MFEEQSTLYSLPSLYNTRRLPHFLLSRKSLGQAFLGLAFLISGQGVLYCYQLYSVRTVVHKHRDIQMCERYRQEG